MVGRTLGYIVSPMGPSYYGCLAIPTWRSKGATKRSPWLKSCLILPVSLLPCLVPLYFIISVGRGKVPKSGQRQRLHLLASRGSRSSWRQDLSIEVGRWPSKDSLRKGLPRYVRV